MQLVLELFICAHQEGEMVCYHRLCRDISRHREDPDGIVLRLLLESGIDTRDHSLWSHSTSWRFEQGRTVLTYIVWVPARLLRDLPTRCLAVASVTKSPPSAGTMAPRPREIREEDVLVHGLRHLNYLACHKEEPLARKALADAESLAFIQRLSPEPAGRLL